MKQAVRILDRIVNFLIVICFLPVLMYGLYGLWDSAHITRQADTSLYQQYRPDEGKGISFEELQKINPEVFGWLTIPGTHIDYPVVQAEGNTKYVNTDVRGEFALSGSIFLDCRNHKDFSDCNHVIYGHHMQEDAMFGELEKFRDKNYFDGHRTGEIYYENTWHEIEFFAFVPADAYDPVLYNTNLKAGDCGGYLDYVKEHADIFRDYEFKGKERFVALSTCTSESSNGRHILIGRITKKTGNHMGEKMYEG